MSTEVRRSSAEAPVLVRARDLGGHDEPGPRDLPAPDRLIRWGRPLLLPFSSAMRVLTDDPVIGLTYDDGPDPEHTPQILAELRRRDVRATFFVLVEAAERHPQLVRDLLAEGHEVGLHGIDHTLLTTVSWREAARAVRQGRRRLERVTGERVRLYRPTYGIQGPAQYLAARLAGLEVVFWTAWAQDWLQEPAESIAARAVTAGHPGAILLLHDTTGDATPERPAPTFSRAEVTARVVDLLHGGGYRLMPAGALLAAYPAVRAVTITPPSVPGPGRGRQPA
ncbi:MAG: polysaccharide deacetylase family protein [Kineosporiaceae bacterium]